MSNRSTLPRPACGPNASTKVLALIQTATRIWTSTQRWPAHTVSSTARRSRVISTSSPTAMTPRCDVTCARRSHPSLQAMRSLPGPARHPPWWSVLMQASRRTAGSASSALSCTQASHSALDASAGLAAHIHTHMQAQVQRKVPCSYALLHTAVSVSHELVERMVGSRRRRMPMRSFGHSLAVLTQTESRCATEAVPHMLLCDRCLALVGQALSSLGMRRPPRWAGARARAGPGSTQT